jgi:hypothetical protein
MIIEAKLESSAIESIHYDENLDNLRVTFHSGGSYDYPSVPKEKVLGLLSAESAGKYFHQNIRQYSIHSHK